MITAAELKSQTVKGLASMAKRKGVAGWHAMRKEELVQALLKQAKLEAAQLSKKHHGNGSILSSQNGQMAAKKGGKIQAETNGSSNGNGHAAASTALAVGKPRSPRVEKRLAEIREKLAGTKDIAYQPPGVTNGDGKDRLVVLVRDSYWLHAYWELTRHTIDRAKAAMGPHWHGAQPILRLSEVTRNGTTSGVRKAVRDIPIHGGVNNWYIDVAEPPKSYQMEIGYMAPGGKFLSMARSNIVTTPTPGAPRPFDGNWAGVAEDFDRIFAMSGGYSEEGSRSDLKELFEKRLRRPMGNPMATRFGLGSDRFSYNGNKREFCFEVDAELIVYGVTEPGSHVTLRGEPVRLEPDGTFTMRFELPDRRQVLPVVASSGDGVEQRTIVLAVERNTKVMEPVIRESDG